MKAGEEKDGKEKEERWMDLKEPREITPLQVRARFV